MTRRRRSPIRAANFTASTTSTPPTAVSFPTSGVVNPSLTLMALGYRVGYSIVHPQNPLIVARKIDRALL
jgi:hypothetical protein